MFSFFWLGFTLDSFFVKCYFIVYRIIISIIDIYIYKRDYVISNFLKILFKEEIMLYIFILKDYLKICFCLGDKLN